MSISEISSRLNFPVEMYLLEHLNSMHPDKQDSIIPPTEASFIQYYETTDLNWPIL